MSIFLLALLCAVSDTARPRVDLLHLAAPSEGNGLPSGWQVRSVKGFSAPSYHIDQDTDGARLRISGRASAAWAYTRLDQPVEPTSGTLSWTARVLERPIGADLRTSPTDDSALRVYVVFGSPPGPFGSGGHVIFYTWGNAEPSDFMMRSFPSKRMHIIRVAGDEQLGPAWHHHAVDPFADFRRLWGGKPAAITAIGIMQDTDATHGAAIAEVRRLDWSPLPLGTVLQQASTSDSTDPS